MHEHHQRRAVRFGLELTRCRPGRGRVRCGARVWAKSHIPLRPATMATNHTTNSAPISFLSSVPLAKRLANLGEFRFEVWRLCLHAVEEAGTSVVLDCRAQRQPAWWRRQRAHCLSTREPRAEWPRPTVRRWLGEAGEPLRNVGDEELHISLTTSAPRTLSSDRTAGSRTGTEALVEVNGSA